MTYVMFPTTDSGLLGWSLNFNTLVAATPTSFGLTAAQATAYGVLHAAYATTLAACEPSVRTKTAVVAKNAARAALKNGARQLAAIVSATAGVTNAQKTELGLKVQTAPVPVPPPTTCPVMQVQGVEGWTVKIKLKNGAAGRRTRPVGTSGAAILSYVGTTPPVDAGQWKFEGLCGRPEVEILFDSSLAAGTKVWLSAFWFNGRKESGPACPPVSTNLQGGSVQMSGAMPLSIAA